MNIFKNAAHWVLSQFRTHTVRSVLVTFSALALAAIGILWSLGFFTAFSYLPDRAYILADTEIKEPQTLEELLHSDAPSIDSLLRNPAIAEELLSAAQLTDIVDSRLALNNLRSLDRQLSERLEESDETIQLLDFPAYAPEGASSASLRNEPEKQATVSPLLFNAGEVQAPMILLANQQPDIHMSAPSARQALAAQTEILTNLQAATQNLLMPPSDAESVEIPSTVNMKGVWQNPGEILLHMTPSGDWVPEGGFMLYREIDGRRELVKEGVASPAKGQSGLIELEGWEVDDEDEYEKHRQENINLIQELYGQAELTPSKLAAMGMANAEEFRSAVYRTDTLESKPRVSGGVDFERMRDMRITIPGDIGQKIPETDILLGNPIYVQNRLQNNALTSASIQSSIWQKFSLIQANPISGLSLLEGRPEFQIAYEIFTARQQLMSLSFVNDEFAEEAGFLFFDDLSDLELKDDADIAYYVETPGGTLIGRVFLTNGKTNDLTKPQGLLGYGIDGRAPLRWDQALSEAERGIISGYIIERKLDGEKDFVRVNQEPVAISYMLDESDVYFESPIFFEDEVENGRTAQYRICSIDVFGRSSEYSDVIEFKVEKVTPPNAPAISPATLSMPGKSASRKDAMDSDAGETTPIANHSIGVNQSIEANKNKRGIVLPIFADFTNAVRFTDSADSAEDIVRFTIYRAVAEGAKGFGPPEILSDIKYDNPSLPVGTNAGESSAERLSQSGSEISQNVQSAPSVDQLVQQNGRLTWQGKSVISSITKNRAKQIILDTEISGYPDLTYFDADVKEGYTYKYWVSAWDSWNNESAWSQSVTMGVPTKAEPKTPAALNIKMLARELLDLSALPPGVLGDPLVSYEALANAAGGHMRQYEDDIDTDTVKAADAAGIRIGSFTSASSFPTIISTHYDNLPEEKYIHMFLAVRGEDVLPDGTARLKWPAYSGEGLVGYMIYRPLFAPGPLSEMQKMSRNELMQMGQWQLANDNNSAVTQNQLVVGGLDRTPGNISLFLICLKPSSFAAEYANMDFTLTGPDSSGLTRAELAAAFQPFGESPASGYVDITWEAPGDPQVAFYRVYRSEVSKQIFQQESDAQALDWTLVGDRITAPTYTDPVEQSFAHYYYYKVTSVSPWGVESTVGATQRFRVPATKPPQTPNLLLPLSRKDGVQVNFAAVNYCDRYEIYRTEIPRPTAAQLAGLMSTNPDLFKVLFDTPSGKDSFLTGMLNDSINPVRWKEFIGPQAVLPQYQSAPSAAYNADFLLYSPAVGAAVTPVQYPSVTQSAPVMALQKFKTLSQLDSAKLISGLAAMGDASGLKAYQTILEQLGPLALADYRDLSLKMMEMVSWTKLGEIPAAEQEEDPTTGLLKPLSFIDETAEYGITYLYTVQAWNDDNLGSGRPEPIEATPRRNGPFDPIGGLTGKIVDMYPNLAWNAPTMKNLTEEQCREDTVGYIVYRSDKKDGTYYQASPLLFEREWIDKDADLYAFNWYQVKVLDTGGYLSEFSEPLLVRGPFASDLQTIIPDAVQEMTPPEITLSGTSFSIRQGSAFEVAYTLTGTEPIAVTVAAKNAKGTAVSGFSVNTATRTVNVPGSLPVGSYTVTVTAKNSAGESSKSFTLEVTATAPVVTPPELTLERARFIIKQGSPFQTSYSLTGSEPITVTVKAAGPDGGAVGGFTVNTAAHTIKASAELSPAVYTVTVTAKNSAGESSKSFDLIVEAAPQLTPPKLEAREDDYSFSMSRTFDFSEQLFASGSEPLFWSLEPISSRMIVPAEAGIDDTGLLSISKDIPMGNYRFKVRVENSAGFDTKEIALEVKARIIIPKIGGLSTDSGPEIVRLTAVQPRTAAPLTTTPQIVQPGAESYYSAQMRCMSFFLTEVQLSRPLGSAGLFTGYSGTAMLNISGAPIPVSIIGASVEKAGSGAGQDKMTGGTVYITEPLESKDIGLTIVSLNISPAENKAEVSGYIKNPQSDLNVLGDRYAIQFKDAELRPGNIIIRRGVPTIRHEQFTIRDIQELWINISKDADWDLFTLVGGSVEMKSHLETLDNKSLRFKPFSVSFDRQGRMNADLSTDGEQALRLIVPGGAALRVEDAFLAIRNGVVQSNSYLLGKLVLPFEKADIQGPGVPGTYAGSHPYENELDAIAGALNADALKNMPGLSGAMQKALVKYGERAQQNGLLVVPDDFSLQDQCSSVSIEVHDWSGAGFTIESAEMTPANMAERSLTIKEQRSQGIVIKPTAVSVDLDRENFIQKANAETGEKIMTPKETEKPFWVGLVMHGGTVALPPDFVQKDGGGTIEFALAKGEMIYDLNGFNYQTYLYNDEGVPADFGPALGGFTDVWVYDCLLDLYANKVNLEINAEVAVDLFRGNRVEAKLYTNKKDNEDGKKGEFLCSVAPTTIEDAPATGIDMTIDGGWFRKEGMYISGSVVAEIDEIQTGGEPMPFTDLIVPADIRKSGAMSEAKRQYSAVELDRPINIDFQGFTMEIRALDMTYKEHPTGSALKSDIWLTLHGATLLAENIPLSSDTTDTVVVACPVSDPHPVVLYEQSHSVLNANFDGCIEVSGVLVPKAVPPGGDGLVEFDTEQLGLSFLSQLDVVPVNTSARFGYDSVKGRYYFVVGIATAPTVQVPFGVGRMNDFAGLVSYNMIAERDNLRRLQIPSYEGMEEFIKRQQVDREGGTSFVAGVSTTLVVMELCEIRDLYFGFESGPIVDAGGELWLPLKVEAMVQGDSDIYTKVGTAALLYSHPERYFSFSTIIDLNVAVAQVGGTLGFEYSPRVFGVYLGYPEMLGGRIGVMRVGMGVGYLAEDDAGRMIRMRAEFGYDANVDISIVYLRAYLYAGADGAYYFGGSDADKIILELYLKGGVDGGIRALGRRYNIISFYLDANGKMTAKSPYDSWLLEASCKVSYSLDVWVHSFDGTVTARFDKRLG